MSHSNGVGLSRLEKLLIFGAIAFVIGILWGMAK